MARNINRGVSALAREVGWHPGTVSRKLNKGMSEEEIRQEAGVLIEGERMGGTIQGASKRKRRKTGGNGNGNGNGGGNGGNGHVEPRGYRPSGVGSVHLGPTAPVSPMTVVLPTPDVGLSGIPGLPSIPDVFDDDASAGVIVGPDGQPVNVARETLLAKLRKEMAAAIAIEIKNAEDLGRLIPRREAMARWGRMVGEVQGGVMRMAELADQLAMMTDAREIRVLLEEEARRILEKMVGSVEADPEDEPQS